MGRYFVRPVIVAALLLLSMLLLVSAASVSVGQGQGAVPSSSLLGLSAHSVIRIDSDADLQAQAVANSWPGNGSAGDPYVIEDYDIDATGQGNAIFVGNTTHHLVIRNCSLHDAGYISWPYQNGEGLMLYGSQNITVRDNSIDGNYVTGICLMSSRSISILNNTLVNNLLMWDSEWSTISLNTISSPSDWGLYLSGSSNNTISYNSVSAITGIYLYSYSSNNTILHNDCSGNSLGVHLFMYCHYNTISHNNCSDGSDTGIYLHTSYHNTLSFNNCSGNGQNGINIYAMYTNVTSNDCVGNGGQGINLTGHYNTITENDCRLNYYGIRSPLSAQHNDISYNICDHNDYMGIILQTDACHNNTISHNQCSHMSYGIYINGADFNTIHNNTCDLGAYGINLASNANYNTIAHNHCDDNMYGIYELGTINNTIAGNLCRGNTFDGITAYVNGAPPVSPVCKSVIIDNDCSGNTRYGIVALNAMALRNDCNDNGDSGIFLVTNSLPLFYSTIAENNCNNNTYGIHSRSSVENVIHGNNCSGNSNTGILLNSSTDHLIFDNTCIENAEYGMLLRSSAGNTLSFNICGHNGYGIGLQDASEMNEVIRNTCEFNSYHGIHLLHSNLNDVHNNTCNDNALAGIRLDSSNNNAIGNNTCTDNWHGVDLLSSANNSVISNHCERNVKPAVQLEHGIYLSYSSNNTLSLNECVGNGESGVHLEYSTENLIRDNLCSGNNRGIFLVHSSAHNVLANNTCPGNSIFGIYLMYSSDHNDVYGNLCNDGGTSGMYLYLSGENSIHDNRFNDNGMGVCLVSSSNNTIYNNTFIGNTDHGVYIESSDGNLLFGNTLIGNNGATTVYSSSNTQAYDDGTTNHWNSSSHGNYWDDWCTPDDDGDGIVDFPYSIEGGANLDGLPIFVGITISSPPSGMFTIDPNALLQGNATSILGITSLIWHNTATGATGACEGSPSWTCTVPLSEGANLITVTMIAGGGVERSIDITLLLDTTAPSLEVTSPANGSFNNTRTITVVWVASDEGSGITHYNVSANGVDWFTTTDTSYTFPGLSDGVYMIIVSAHDMVGNHNDITVTATVDATAPTLSIGSPTEGSFNNTGDVTITWTGGDDGSGIAHYSISIDGQTPEQLMANIVQFDLSGLADGHHTINITAMDLAGNSAWQEVGFTVDTLSPVLVITSPVEGSYLNVSSGLADWTASDATMIISTSVRLDGEDWDEIGVVTEWPFSSLAEGEHTLEVMVTDQAGNQASAVTFFIVDTVAPTATGSPSGEGVGLDAIVEVQFSEPMDPDTVNISIDGVTGTLVLFGTSAMFIPSVDLSSGRDYTVIVTGHDLARNPLSMSWTFTTVFTNGSVIGKVVDEAGLPLTGATVSLGEVRATVTGPDGNFLFEGVTIGNYTLTIQRAGYQTLTVNVTVNANQTSDLGELELVAQRGSVEGIIVDGDGNPIADAAVSLSGGNNTITDANGHFSFEGVLVGDHTLSVQKAGYQPLVSEITVSEGETEDLGELTLEPLTDGGADDGGNDQLILALLIVLVIAAICIMGIFLWKMKGGR